MDWHVYVHSCSIEVKSETMAQGPKMILLSRSAVFDKHPSAILYIIDENYIYLLVFCMLKCKNTDTKHPGCLTTYRMYFNIELLMKLVRMRLFTLSI